MLAPFGEGLASSPLSTLLMLIAVFGVGILLSMSLFGVAFARLMSAAVAARLGQAAAVLMAVRVDPARGVLGDLGLNGSGFRVQGSGFSAIFAANVN